MYEDQNYLTLMERMLGRTPNDLDKSEGSILWEGIGPSAAEFELVYIAIDNYIKNAYPMTADREALIKFADTYNMAPYEATKALLKAEFTMRENRFIDPGSRFMIDGLIYVVTERIADNQYSIECETAGAIGNKYYGQLLPVVFLNGFVSAHIIDLQIPGEDEEDTEEFRLRFKRSFISKAYGGNEADYFENFVLPLQGVADCKVLRCPRGKGTVDVIIIDSLYHAPSQELLEEVQTSLRPLDITEPPEIDKCGLGICPIGHETLVFGVKESPVEIGLKLEFEDGYTWEGLAPIIESELSNYFLELAQDWGDKNYYTKTNRKEPEERYLEIQLSRIEQRVFNIPGVKDYDRFSTTINGKSKNTALAWDEIPILSAVIESEGGTGRDPEDGECNCPDCCMDRKCSQCERALNV